MGKAPSTAGAPSGTASQSSVTASSGFPTIAESLGQKRSPPLKAALSSKSTTTPASQTEKSQVAAAKGPPPATPQEKAGASSRPPATPADSKAQVDPAPQKAQRAPAAPVAIEKDAAMSHTEQVTQQAATAMPVSKLSDEDYENLMQERWQRMMAESASRIAHKPAPVGHLPQELRGEILPPQPLSSPIRGWIDGMTPPVRKEGRTIELSLPRSGRTLQMDLIGRDSTFEKESKDKSPKTRPFGARNGEAHYDHRPHNG